MKKKVTVYIPEEAARKLKALAALQGTTMSDLITRLILLEIESYQGDEGAEQDRVLKL